jgi:hypothetical protein
MRVEFVGYFWNRESGPGEAVSRSHGVGEEDGGDEEHEESRGGSGHRHLGTPEGRLCQGSL